MSEIKITEQQRKIITAPEDKVVVMSSAGTSKTFCLIERIKWLVSQGTSPSHIVAITFTNNAAQEIINRLEPLQIGFCGTVHSFANFLLHTEQIATRETIESEDFDELFNLVKQNPRCVENFPVDHLLLDEAQDSNNHQFEFILEMVNPKRFTILGDEKQCQPAGTKITLVDGSTKNIEDLIIGDEILTYSEGRVCGGTAPNSKNKRVLQIEKHLLPPAEKLLQITLASGEKTFYTAGHYAMASLCLYDEYNFITYLMCDKNNRFRVGVSQFRNSNTAPWRAKMRAEKCDRFWILQSFKTRHECLVLESKVSYKYGIPQNTFQLGKTHDMTQEDLDYIYEGLDTYTSAEKCLKDFHRDIRYPFCSLYDNIHYAGNAYNKTYACNLLPHNMKMRIYDTSETKVRFSNSEIVSIDYVDYNGYVYSLDVEDNHTYIGDGIITHNCIYSFAGSNPDLIVDLSRTDGVATYKLSENFRNARVIHEFGKWAIERMNCGYYDNSTLMRDEIGKKITILYNLETVANYILQDGKFGEWFVLTRTNAQLEAVKSYLESRGIFCDTFKQKEVNLGQLQEKMKQNTVKVLTIHSSKGLQQKKVVVIGATIPEPNYYTHRVPADMVEEGRLAYVAITRAQDFLLWVKRRRVKKEQEQKFRSWE